MTAVSYFGAGTAEVLRFMGFSSADAVEIGLTDAQILENLARAQDEIKERTKTTFANTSGTASPDYIAVADEKHDGQGKYDRAYYTIKFPLPNVYTYLAATANPASTSLTVDDTTGFPVAGTLGLGTNKVTYTGKSGTVFTGISALSGTVSPDVKVLPFVVEMSTDDQGTNPTWTVLQPDVDYDVDLDSGRFFLYRNWVVTSIYNSMNPPSYTPNRVRFNYIYGWAGIPNDVTRLILMMASRDLLHMAVRKAHAKGFNNFQPGMIDVDGKLIEETIQRYTNPLFGNTH